jgi:hypothetical protein
MRFAFQAEEEWTKKLENHFYKVSIQLHVVVSGRAIICFTSHVFA